MSAFDTLLLWTLFLAEKVHAFTESDSYLKKTELSQTLEVYAINKHFLFPVFQATASPTYGQERYFNTSPPVIPLFF